MHQVSGFRSGQFVAAFSSDRILATGELAP
jgi:hypothetical protein